MALDAKGRLSVPARHREVLQLICQGRLTVTKHPDGCLMLFPRPTWEGFRDKVAALPMSAAGWKRVFLGNAMDVDMDGAVLIAQDIASGAEPAPEIGAGTAPAAVDEDGRAFGGLQWGPNL